jgi:hypothetical protein
MIAFADRPSDLLIRIRVGSKDLSTIGCRAGSFFQQRPIINDPS